MAKYDLSTGGTTRSGRNKLTSSLSKNALQKLRKADNSSTSSGTSEDLYARTKAANDLIAPIIQGLKVNNLDAYVTSQLRNDYIRDRGTIEAALNKATNAAYDTTRAQALQDAARAEDTSYRNTQNAIAEMRRNLVGSGSSGANVGAANATALQALLGLGQQNVDTTTEGLRNINNVGRERAATLAQNAVDAISQANDATSKMYDAATSAYASDRSYAAQGAAEALATLASAADTARANERIADKTNSANASMNNTTAAANMMAAYLGANGKQTVINKTGKKKK